MKYIKFNLSVLLLFLFLTPYITLSQTGGFTAYFTGEQEVPPVNTNARGTASVDVINSNSVAFYITVNGLSGPITGAHFHIAPIGIPGPVVRAITANFTGTTAYGTWENIPDSLLDALLTEKLYLNIHTAAYPNGEIRGQLFHSAATALSAKLTSFQVVPSLNLNAKGTASMALMFSGISYHISVTGLSGPVRSAEFRWGPIGINGPVLRDITEDFNNGFLAEGRWPSSGPGAINDSILVGLLTGKVYISVNTDANTGGEIRGQVDAGIGFGLATSLNGLFEVPPVLTLGRGAAAFTLTPAGLVFKITVNNLTGPIIGAHFHNAPFGSVGPVVKTINLAAGENNTYTGVWRNNDTEPLTPQMISELIRGNIYVNFHTPAYPAGEIRGQVLMLPINTFAAKIEDDHQETPGIKTFAKGTGTFALTQRDLLAFQINVSGLTEPIISASFNYGTVRQNGPILKEIGPFFSGNTAFGVWKFTERSDTLFKALLEGKIYVIIRTQSNPNGVLRGQVSLSSGTGLAAILEGNQETPPVNTTGKGVAALTLTPSGLVYDITVNGLTGPITGAHFHYAPIGVPGPVVKNITPDVHGNHIQGVWNEFLVGTDDSLFIALVTGKLYLNVHTAANPNGEIRGQVLPGEGMGFVGRLNGQQEIPPVTTTGMGTASASLTNAGLIFYSSVDSLSGPITGVHFHNAPIGAPGPVVRDLAPFMDPVNDRNVKGVWRRTDDEHFKRMLMSQVVVNNIYINFHTSAYPNGEVRGQLMRNGIFPSTDISSNRDNMAGKKFSLNQNYPNPFNPTTTIKFSIPQSSVVKLVLYDVLGREVSTLVNKEMKAGTYDVEFDGSNLASGIYFYRLESAGFTDVKRMILVK